jgi:hypothetical protein
MTGPHSGQEQSFPDKQLTEIPLRESQGLLRQALKMGRMFAWRHDLITGRMILSEQSWAILGLTPGSFGSTFAEFLGWVHPADRAAVSEATVGTGREDAPYEAEFRIVHSDGRVRWLRSWGDFVRDDQGRTLYLEGIAADISADKQAQAALETKEARFSSIINSAMDAIISVDEEQCIVLFNPAAEQMFGYQAADLVGQSLERLIPVRFRDAHIGHIHKFGATGNTSRAMGALGTVSGVRRSGEEFPVEASISQVAADGKKLYTVILRDITARKKAEALQAQHALQVVLQRDVQAALAESTSLAGILQQCAEAIIQHLKATLVCVWTLSEDSAALELQASAGVPAPSDGAQVRILVGQFRIGLIAAERQPYFTNDVSGDCVSDPQWARREGLVSFAGYPLLVGERLIGVLAMFARAPVLEETLTGLAAIADILAQGIDRQRMRRELRENDERLIEQGALLHYAQEAIIAVDPADRIVFWNRGAERLYGWQASEVIGRNLNTEIFHQNKSQWEDARAILFEKGEYAGELKQLTRDGREIMVDSRYTVVRDPGGRHKSTLVIHADITEKKKLEAQLLRTQRLESIGTLSSGIAHDLNNILSPITMGTQMLKLKVQDEQSQRLLDVMQASAERGGKMISQILSFARGISGERALLQPKHLIREIVRIATETFPRSIRIESHLSEGLWEVHGDATQLHQVLLNLCVNARDAMPRGGTLTIKAENRILDKVYAQMLKGASPGNFAVITVTDTGEGISPEIIDRIFDPFFTTKEPGRGTGLGLAMVQGIVSNHHGFVLVESNPGSGTSFSVWLPTQAVEQLPESANRLLKFPSGHNELILIVDDEAGIREMLKTLLESCGYRTLVAADGAEALKIFASQGDEIHLVITDMMMPVIDGAVTIRALQKMKPSIPIITSSGQVNAEKNEDYRKLGVKQILPKPYNMDTLLQTVACVLGENS